MSETVIPEEVEVPDDAIAPAPTVTPEGDPEPVPEDDDE